MTANGNALNLQIAQNSIIYAPTADTIASLATANDSILGTSASGLPGMTQTLPTAVQSNITSLGTVVSGVFQGSPIGVAYGGTGSNNAEDALFTLGALALAGGTMTGALILNADPVLPFQASTKSYIDNLITGLNWKNSAVTISTSNITLSGEQTVNGIALVAGDRVLINAQTNQTQNGIYVVAVGAWSRSDDANTADELSSASILINSGTLYPGTQWTCNSTNIVIGVTNIVFAQFGGAGTYLADETTLHLAGNVFSIISTYAGQSSITTLGTITSGAWNATAINDAYIATPYIKADGTRALSGNWNAGANSATFNSVQVGSSANTISGLSTIVNGAGTLTLPTSTDTLTGRATTDTFTHKTYDTAGAGNSFMINGTAITAVTGSGAVVLATNPTLIGPVLGVATATSYNGMTITTSSGTFSLTNTKVFTVSNTLTLTGNDSSTVAFGAGGTVTYTTNNLSVFAATTSAQLAGIISDETGSGALVFATNPTLIGPILGSAFATSINKLTITTPATGSTLTIIDGKTLTSSNTLTLAGTDGTTITFQGTDTYVSRTSSDTLTNKSMSGLSNTFTNIPDSAFSSSYLKRDGSTALTSNWAAGAFSATFNSVIVGFSANTIFGATSLSNATSVLTLNTTGTITIPNATDTLIGKATVDVLTNKTYDTAGTGNSFSINGTAITAVNGTGAASLTTNCIFVTPTLGVASATSINKVAITAPATSATLTIANGKTLTASNTLTFTGTDSSSIAFGAGGTVAYTANTLAVFASTTSAQLAGIISDETGTGSLVFNNTPSFITPVLGDASATSQTVTGTAGAGYLELQSQSSVPTAGATNSVRLYASGGGLFGFVRQSDGFARRFGGAITATRLYTLPDLDGEVSLFGNSSTGSGNVVLATNPTLATPILGVATATSINKVAITAPATAATLTIANNKTLTISNSLTFAGTDSTIITFQGTGTYVSTNSTDTLTNKTMSGGSNTFSNIATSSLASTTGSGSVVLDTNAALTTPTATSININGVNGAGFLQLNSQVSGTPTTGNSNSVRLFSTSGGILAYIQQNDGFIRFFGGTFTANRTITFQDKTGTVYVTGGTNVAIADGGTGAGSAAAARTNLGINLNSARNYSDHSALGFGVARTPSATNDTLVVCSIQITEAAGNSGTVTAQIDGTTDIAKVSLNNNVSGTLGSIITINSMTFICPANSSYQLNSAGGGTRSLSTLYELTL